MAEDKRFYWVKLDYRRFENGGDLDFLMGQKNGAEYVVLYMMLCLNTRNTNGEFVAKLGEVVIPYDVDKIVRDCKYFSRDTVMVALELYKQLGLVYVNEGGVMQIANFDDVVGSEGASAKRVREHRKRALTGSANVTPSVTDSVTPALQSNTDVTQEIRDKRQEIRVKSKEGSTYCAEPSQATPPEGEVFTTFLAVSGDEVPIMEDYVKEMEACYPAVDVRAELLKAKAWLINNPANRKTVGGMHRFIGNWLGREQNRAVRKEGMGVANTARDYTGQYKGDKFEVM